MTEHEPEHEPEHEREPEPKREIPTPTGGFLLVASPDLKDPNFERTVVLMLNHDDEGAFGLVLNRPLEHRLVDVIEDVDPRWADVQLHQGGPVQTNVLQFVCRDVGKGQTVVEDVSVGAGLEDLLESEPAAGGVRAFAGYAGWGGGQLEQETSEGSWIVRPAEARHVFGIPPERLWVTVLRELGGNYAWMSLSGGDPSEN